MLTTFLVISVEPNLFKVFPLTIKEREKNKKHRKEFCLSRSVRD